MVNTYSLHLTCYECLQHCLPSVESTRIKKISPFFFKETFLAVGRIFEAKQTAGENKDLLKNRRGFPTDDGPGEWK